MVVVVVESMLSGGAAECYCDIIHLIGRLVVCKYKDGGLGFRFVFVYAI